MRLVAVRVLRQGPIPQHVGFIMDGNRRFAKKSHMETPSRGHLAGFTKLTKVLEWCNDLGIKHRLVEDVENGLLSAADINETALEKRLQIPGPDLDILVRTSGQIRFSNFMLWQSAKMAYIQFVDAYWPEFSFYHMARILVSWQLASRDIERRKLAGAVHDSLASSEQLRSSESSSDTCCGDRT
ncbi:hypothetical protein H4R27_001866 [Coemansia aciculifera]|nr:hypothetical protein H4R27_001866 [Coemansia aciculifera]